MDISEFFKVAGPQIVHESFEDEVILINFNSGAYYSLRGTGSFIWNLIEQKVSVETIIKKTVEYFKADPDYVRKSLEKFFTDIRSEGLIEPLDTKTGAKIEEDEVILPKAGLDTHDFQAPVLQKYTDVQELLLLDPIHDVNESGWPFQKPDLPEKDENNPD